MKNIFTIMRMLLSSHTAAQKINYLRYKFSKKRSILKYGPVTISIVPTTRCTLSCDMCPTHSAKVPRDYPHTQKDAKDMDFGMFKDIIDRFKSATTVHMIGSGEPFLNKDFFRMVDYAAGKRMMVKTFSNGTTVGDNIDNILHSRLDGLTISVNGHDAKEFKRMTGMDETVYRRIYKDTERLINEKRRRGSKIKIKISFIIDKLNYKDIPEMISAGTTLGADHMFFCNFLPSPFKGLNAEERPLTSERKIIEGLKNIFNKYPSSVMKKITPPVSVDKKKNGNQCDTYFSQIRFDGDGNVSSCSMMLLDMTGHGDFTQKEIWNNDFFKTMRDIFLSGDEKALPEPCRVCPDNKGRPLSF